MANSANGIVMEPFTLHETGDFRLLHQYRVLNSTSHLKCLIECSLDKSCMSVNYNWGTLCCELTDINIYTVNSYQSEIVENWTIYTKQIESCDDGWISHEQSCYFFSFEQSSTWTKANADCEAMDATLVQIESENENTFIVEKLQERYYETLLHTFFWTSGTDDDVENQWVWGNSGVRIADNYQNWAHGEPNGGVSENCLVLSGFPDYSWLDIDCNASLYFICEKTLSS